MNVHVEVIDNSDKIKAAAEEQIAAALEACGLKAEGLASENVTAAGRIDTGDLRDRITHTVKKDTVYIGTNVEYAVYHEVGTGIYTPGGRQTPWKYVDRHGDEHWTRGIRPIHFLKNAIVNHLDEYKAIIETHLKG